MPVPLFKTTPFAHQLAEFEISKDLAVRGVFWEQGTGKTKLVIDTAAHLCRTGEIDGVLVVAPNGVHGNWITDEIPTHWPDDVSYISFEYRSSRAGTKKHKQALDWVTNTRDVAILCMSYNGIMTEAGRKAAEKFLARRHTLFVLDESQRIKSPGAKRTFALVAMGRRASYKRILSGTPITNKPFDAYPQIKFLDEEFWRQRGFDSFLPFKHYFANWEIRTNYSTGRTFEHPASFRNLDELGRYVSEIASRVTKDQVLDLPPKLYQKRYFDLTSEQEKLYQEIRDDFLAFLDDGEQTVSAPLVITRLLRLQQIACGYVPLDPAEMGAAASAALKRFNPNPRLAALLEILEDLEGQAIIWARFQADIDQIMEALGQEAVRYDGRTSADDRLTARQRFQDGSARYFVANPAAAGTGLTLTAASHVIYYSNSFNYEDRVQSEDRAHRIGQTKSVTYIDLIANGTIDSKIVEALRKKLDIASQITGDKAKEWI